MCLIFHRASSHLFPRGHWFQMQQQSKSWCVRTLQVSVSFWNMSQTCQSKFKAWRKILPLEGRTTKSQCKVMGKWREKFLAIFAICHLLLILILIFFFFFPVYWCSLLGDPWSDSVFFFSNSTRFLLGPFKKVWKTEWLTQNFSYLSPSQDSTHA